MNAPMPSYLRRFRAAQARLRRGRSVNTLLCFAEAFEECEIAVSDLADIRFFDPGADHALGLIRDAIDCREIIVWGSRGKAYARAEQLSRAERAAFEDALERIIQFMDSREGKRYLRAIEQERAGARRRRRTARSA